MAERAGVAVRDAIPDDFAAILELNRIWVAVLSPMDGPRLAQLHAQAALHRVVEMDGRIAAFLLAFREGSAYDGANYRWFAGRYRRFLYVDRVVVAADRQRHGFGQRLYRDALASALRDDVPTITCEFDVQPPNEASRRFHAAFGFEPVGRRTLHGGKVVSMQALDVVRHEPARRATGAPAP